VPRFANRQRDPRGGDIQIRHGRGAAPVPLTNEPVPALFSPVMRRMTP